MASNAELIAEFDWEKFVFQDNTPDRTIIGSLADGRTVKGRAANGALETGVAYRFYGQWRTHDRYGKQFWFSSFVLAQPISERGTRKYLARARGVGKATARAIWEAYGSDSLEVCRNEPARVAAEIKGMTPAKAQAASEDFRAWQAREGVTIELEELIGKRGFPKSTTDNAISIWGVRAPEVIRENPYVLLTFPGCGFLGCDKFWLDLGKPADDMQRQVMCAWYGVESDNEGHTWLEENAVRAFIRTKVSGVNLNIDKAMQTAYEQDLLRLRVEGGRRYVATAKKADAESALADYLHQAMHENDDSFGLPDTRQLRWPLQIEGLYPQQQQELLRAVRGPVGILSGGPGAGKTVVSSKLIDAIQHMAGCGVVGVVAPTGKAAVRISEAMAAQGLTIKATTIHRLLQVKSAGSGGWEFEFGEGNPLPHDFIFVDEPSMIDTGLMCSLFAARKKGCHMLFSGDPHQLPPVGHGAPFRDMLEAAIPQGHLTEIHRNAGTIVRCCKSIREDRKLTLAEEISLPHDNLCVAPTTKPEGTIRQIQSLLTHAWGRGFDPIDDCQVIVPINEKSEVSRKRLNPLLQGHLNPNGETCERAPFRCGDKIVCKSNSRMPAADDCPPDEIDDEGKVYVANGEQARVQSVSPGFSVAALNSPPRSVVIPHVQSEGDEAGKSNWELAYAISCHKSQGSQWPVVIVVIDDSGAARKLCDSHWLTTAISRAERYCVLVGRESRARDFVRKSGLWKRRTFLCSKIRELE